MTNPETTYPQDDESLEIGPPPRVTPASETPLATTQGVNNPLQMLDSAIQKGHTPETLKQLMDLSERWEANQARKAYYEALSNFREVAPVVTKDRTVRFTTDKGVTEYDHASLGNIIRHLNPLLAQFGLSFHWRTTKTDAMVRVACVITHRNGHSEEESSLEAGLDQSGGKNNVQALGSTQKYLQRYTLEAALGITTADDDNDGADAGKPELPRLSENQIADLESLISEVGANRDGFLDYYKITQIKDLPAQCYEEADRLLRKSGRQRTAGRTK